LKEGDRNTKFFHRKAASRAKKNKIKLLKKGNGEVTKEKERDGINGKRLFSAIV
jgi:hypothetical protein